MADLDTEDKRRSSVNISLYPMGASLRQPRPIDFQQNRRQETGYGYFGILAASPEEEGVPARVRIGAHGVLHGRGKTPIGRGL